MQERRRKLPVKQPTTRNRARWRRGTAKLGIAMGDDALHVCTASTEERFSGSVPIQQSFTTQFQLLKRNFSNVQIEFCFRFECTSLIGPAKIMSLSEVPGHGIQRINKETGRLPWKVA